MIVRTIHDRRHNSQDKTQTYHWPIVKKIRTSKIKVQYNFQ